MKKLKKGKVDREEVNVVAKLCRKAGVTKGREVSTVGERLKGGVGSASAASRKSSTQQKAAQEIQKRPFKEAKALCILLHVFVAGKKNKNKIGFSGGKKNRGKGNRQKGVLISWPPKKVELF